MVPFDCVIDETFKQKHDLQAIEDEIPIFTVECMRTFFEAFQRGELTESVKMKEAKEKWLKESNHVLRFIEEMCDLDMESKEGDSSKMIYEEYRNFYFKESLKELSQPKFTKQLEKMGIFRRKQSINGTRMCRYTHLKLKNEYTPIIS